ncbi:MAG: polysaccharide deacetylase family protein [Thiohalocapsa sp.]
MQGAFTKLSRPSVEYNLTEHCNLSCYLCDHASPLLPKKFASLHDLTALAQVFHSRQLRIVGGEPLLHPQLPLFLAEARSIGIADDIVLLTNGVLLHRAPDELWDLIDELLISVYPGIELKLDLDKCAEICEQHGARFRVSRMQEFSKTLLNARIEEPRLVQAIFDACETANEWSCHTVYGGRFYRCSIAPFMGPRLALRGVDFDNHEVDGVALHDNPNLYRELEACLHGSTPLAACSYCLGTCGPSLPHRQVNRQGRTRWLEEDDSMDIAAVRARLLGEECRVPILMYHSVADEGPAGTAPYRVSPAAFRQQMEFLRAQGYRSISLDEWARCIASGQAPEPPCCIITFDDGYRNILQNALPVLTKTGFKATVFVVTGRVGGVADWDRAYGEPVDLLDWDELRLWQQQGHAIGSHCVLHRNLQELSDTEIVADGREARAALQRQLGRDVRAIAYPWGLSDERVRRLLVDSGYRIGVDVVGGPSGLGDPLMLLPRIEIFGDDNLSDFARKLDCDNHRADAREVISMDSMSGLPASRQSEPADAAQQRGRTGEMRALSERLARLIAELSAIKTALDEMDRLQAHPLAPRATSAPHFTEIS